MESLCSQSAQSATLSPQITNKNRPIWCQYKSCLSANQSARWLIKTQNDEEQLDQPITLSDTEGRLSWSEVSETNMAASRRPKSLKAIKHKFNGR